MPTGDIKNNLRKLRVELKKIHFQDVTDIDNMSLGVSKPFLPILHYVFMDYSMELTLYFTNKGYDCYGKSDLRFLEVIYKILINEFSMKPLLTKQQFFAVGFAEMKIIFVTKILQLCQEKAKVLAPKKLKKFSSILGKSNVSKSVNESNQLKPDTAISYVAIENDNLILPPKPTQSLALTPMKDVAHRSQGADKKDNLACSLLDVTECESELDNSYSSQVEMVDDFSEDVLPKFRITKHNEVTVLHGQQMSSMLRDSEKLEPTSDPVEVETKSTSKELFPKNKTFQTASVSANLPTVMLKKKNSNGTECFDIDVNKCESCVSNTREIKYLKSKIETMEKQMLDVTNVNNELSAKLILLEMKFKVVENKLTENILVASTIDNKVTDVNDGLNDSKKQLKENNMFAVTSQRSQQTSCSKELSHSIDFHVEKDTKRHKQNSYSPEKYCSSKDDVEDIIEDDILIMQNFKPLRMSDIQQHTTHDKENITDTHTNSKGKGNMGTKLALMQQGHRTNVCSDKSNENSYDELVTSVDNLRNDMTDTKQIVSNVKQKLMETERLLKLGSKP